MNSVIVTGYPVEAGMRLGAPARLTPRAPAALPTPAVDPVV
jgi:hypothetical protein